jgi:glutaredoxin
VYVNVKKDEKELDRMVRLSGGRSVPVIVDGGKVTVGFGGT